MRASVIDCITLQNSILPSVGKRQVTEYKLLNILCVLNQQADALGVQFIRTYFNLTATRVNLQDVGQRDTEALEDLQFGDHADYLIAAVGFVDGVVH